jgi:hypothetical protein
MLARQASTDGSRAKLGGENVDRRVGKVADPSGVVEIEIVGAMWRTSFGRKLISRLA